MEIINELYRKRDEHVYQAMHGSVNSVTDFEPRESTSPIASNGCLMFLVPSFPLQFYF